MTRVYDGVLKPWGRISDFSKELAHLPAALEGWMLPNDRIRLCGALHVGPEHPGYDPRWIGSIQATSSGFSAGSMSRLTTTASLSLRITTHSSGSSRLALIS